MTGVVRNLEHARQISGLARELGAVSRNMASHCLTVELALERRDWETVHEAAEVIVTLTEHFRELRRGLLVAGVRGID